MSATRPASSNWLLLALPVRLLPLLDQARRVGLESGDLLCEAGERTRLVYFPLSGSIATEVAVDQRPPLSLGLIGREGMLGATDVLGVATSPWRAVVQQGGLALRVDGVLFRTLQRRSIAWRRLLLRYVHLLLQQQTRLAGCPHFHRIDARLARWLLMALDRSDGDRLRFSHRMLADALGVQRAAVTLAAGGFQRAGLMHYVRGDIQVLDRHGLEAHACTCYRQLREDAAAMFGDRHAEH